ncbi:MAG: DM13 domain-containing protein [Phycisphaerales bacterium]|nr:DM13 domain-containing protein [Phycisphaerales bacterium]
MTDATAMRMRTVLAALFVFALGAREAAAYSRAGWVADLVTYAHDVQGTVTIVDAQTLRVDHFTYDGGGPPFVYFYLGGNDTDDAYKYGLELQPLLDHAYNDETVMLTLPPGETLDDYTAIAVWCRKFKVDFGSDVFQLVDPADADTDGDIDYDDYTKFQDCMNGPGTAPTPSILTAQECLDAFDRDTDGDVDASDFAGVQRAFILAQPQTAEYELTFDATWSAMTHPSDFPPNPHFSGLIGGTHNSNVDFWEPGGIASQGIENMAELGSKTALTNEVNAAITAGDAGAVISGGGINPSPGSVSVTFTATQEFPLATVTSMIAPSPDWFVATDSYALFRDGQWTPQVTVTMYVYDAGTDSGTTYTSANADTVPQDPIQLITDYPFRPPLEFEVTPVGTFTFQKID